MAISISAASGLPPVRTFPFRDLALSSHFSFLESRMAFLSVLASQRIIDQLIRNNYFLHVVSFAFIRIILFNNLCQIKDINESLKRCLRNSLA